MAMSMGDHQDLALDFYRSRNGAVSAASVGTVSKKSTLSKKQTQHHQPPQVLSKSPPRPSPASVPYNSDEESLKGYDENGDDSSVTEKPSEMSSSDSQVSFEFPNTKLNFHILVYLLIYIKNTQLQSRDILIYIK